MTPAKSKYGIAILAAGSSRRMGRPKLLLPWGATTIIGAQINSWRRLGSPQIVVVHRPDDTALLGELDRLAFPANDRIGNLQADEGMFSSVRCASKWTGWQTELSHCVISLGDQPHLKEETLRALLGSSAVQPEKICQPFYAGRARHPVLFPKQMFRKLRNSDATTLKEFLRTENVVGIELNDPGLALDIDDSADYEMALKLIS